MSGRDDVEADLDEHLWGTDLPETFRVTDDDTAGWAFGKLLTVIEERDRVTAVAGSRRAAITEWETATVKPLDDTIEFFTSLLADYRRQLHQANPKAPATYKLPEGDLKWNKGGTISTISTVPEAFAAFAKANGCDELVRYKPEVRKADVKDSTHFARTPADADGVIRLLAPGGEVVPGVHLVEKAPSVSVVAHRPVAVVTDPEPSEPLPTEPTEEVDQ